jgi:hypothetical protein
MKKIGLWFCLLFLTTVTVVDGYAKLPDGDGHTGTTGTAGTLRRVVSNWIAGGTSRSTVETTYGPIEDWDTSDVSNLNNVFHGFASTPFRNFNADLSNWNLSGVTSMRSSKYLHNYTNNNKNALLYSTNVFFLWPCLLV